MSLDECAHYLPKRVLMLTRLYLAGEAGEEGIVKELLPAMQPGRESSGLTRAVDDLIENALGKDYSSLDKFYWELHSGFETYSDDPKHDTARKSLIAVLDRALESLKPKVEKIDFGNYKREK